MLLCAMEFFIVQTERDILFREKLAVLQRLIITDRVRSFAVLAAGFSHHIRNSMTALKTFLDLVPLKMRDEMAADAQRSPQFWEDLWGLANRESQRILHMVQRVAEAVVEPTCSFKDRVQIPELLKKLAAHAGNAAIAIEGSIDLPELKADAAMLERLVHILADRVHRTGRGGITLRAERVESVSGAPACASPCAARVPSGAKTKSHRSSPPLSPPSRIPRNLASTCWPLSSSPTTTAAT